jgi:hypothetical protein
MNLHRRRRGEDDGALAEDERAECSSWRALGSAALGSARAAGAVLSRAVCACLICD